MHNSMDSGTEVEFLGHNGFALYISSMICKNLKGELKITSNMGIYSEKFVTYRAIFAAKRAIKIPRKPGMNSRSSSLS